MARSVQRESGTRSGAGKEIREPGESSNGEPVEQGATDRRILRSRYLAVKNLISDKREDLARVDMEKFTSIITEVESLHLLVQKPREQVADAEALLDIINTLAASVRSQSIGGVTPSDFVTAMLRNFGQQGGGENFDSAPNMLSWVDVGLAVSDIFIELPGCCTMVGPMNTKMKHRKAVVHRKRTRPTESTLPQVLADSESEAKTDTDRNMSTMFDILRKKKSVRLENLVLNRTSFAQTVENIFALSFLVKDGRAEIIVNESGHHLVSPRNAPSATAVTSGNVSYTHFVFRFDCKDWKLMMDTVTIGEELMPHRRGMSTPGTSAHDDSESAAAATQIRKLTRNHGLVLHEQSLFDYSPENTSGGSQKGKRLCLG
ncbi:non-structural maintenance of chromosomes element 4 homolog A [Phoenix dactylifera]|uniref:Non-structural maintenance of chromosomes element 4 n=1 Tax=Phoenix dactylifera TaxID=42345 RepID=A0A8B7BPQ6_PHODC|nr:non-structural maintenance of chromosomes element 4 homolog A [Phoenix dactylifera]